jgi:hypothetical protein
MEAAMVDYRLKADTGEIVADIKPAGMIRRNIKLGIAWIIWKARVLAGSRVR